MDKTKLTLILAPIGIALFCLIVLGVPANYILFSLSAFYAFVLIFPLLRESSYQDEEQAAWKYAKEAWMKKKREDLSLYHFESLSRFFGDKQEDKLFAFKINRSGESPDKPRQPLVLVVQLYPKPHLRDADDTLENINDEKWVKPFKGVSPTNEGAATPSAFKVMATKGREEKKKKKKTEDKKDEDTDAYQEDFVGQSRE
jgi:hypothetical protein